MPSPPPLPTPRSTRASGRAPGPDHGHPAVVLESGESGQPVARRRARARRGPVSATNSPTARAPGALGRGHVEQADPLVGPVGGVGERPSDELEPGAHPEHHRTRRPPVRPGCRPRAGSVAARTWGPSSPPPTV